jgi:hypothetical protein
MCSKPFPNITLRTVVRRQTVLALISRRGGVRWEHKIVCRYLLVLHSSEYSCAHASGTLLSQWWRFLLRKHLVVLRPCTLFRFTDLHGALGLMYSTRWHGVTTGHGAQRLSAKMCENNFTSIFLIVILHHEHLELHDTVRYYTYSELFIFDSSSDKNQRFEEIRGIPTPW